MIVAINSESTFDYSLISDTGDNKTIFKLGVIDAFVRAFIDDTHTSIKKEDGSMDDIAISDKYVQFVKFGLRGWDNFKDSNGNEILFQTEEKVFPRIGKRTIVSDNCLAKLDLQWIIELGLQIVIHNKLSESESKNS